MARSNGIDDRGYTDTFEREREKLKKRRQAERDSLRHSWEKQLEECDKQEQGLHAALAEEEITPERFWVYMSRIDDKRAKADKARRKALGLPEVDPEDIPAPVRLRDEWVSVNARAALEVWDRGGEFILEKIKKYLNSLLTRRP